MTRNDETPSDRQAKEGFKSLESTLALDPQTTETACNCQGHSYDGDASCPPSRCNPSDDHRQRIAGAISRYLDRQVQR